MTGKSKRTRRTDKNYYIKNEMKRDKKEDSHGCEPARMGHGLVSLFLSGVVRTCVNYPGRCGHRHQPSFST